MKQISSKYFSLLTAGMNLLVCATILFAFSFYVAYNFRKQFAAEASAAPIEGDWPIAADDTIGYVAAKNATTLRRYFRKGLEFHLFTDHLGARVSYPGQQTPDSVDIMTIGGSFAWGYGLSNEQTFTEILGERFHVAVTNLACGGYGTVQGLQLLERYSLLKPKVVIYPFIADHLRRNLSPCAPYVPPFCLSVAFIDFDASGSPFLHPPLKRYSPNLRRRFYTEFIRDDSELNDCFWGIRINRESLLRLHSVL